VLEASGASVRLEDEGWIVIEVTAELPAGASIEATWWMVASRSHSIELPSGADGFRKQWRERIPSFDDESDADLRRELQWHVGCLEAMTNWSAVYGERFIPQGCSYDYDLGVVGSARDLLQHGLAALHYRPALAKSILRHCMKKMTPTGEIRLIEEGGASTSHWFFFTSDQQLYFFYLMAEYLRVTGDTTILDEVVEYYPPGLGGGADGLTRIEQALSFIVHEVKTGENGLLRLLCSDWNDCVYFFLKDRAYPDIYQGAESTLNAAMAVYVCEALAGHLQSIHDTNTKSSERISLLAGALRQLAQSQRTALEKIWQGRDFLPRVLLPGGEAWGADDLFLEPQVFALLDPGWSRERKQKLWQQIKTRVLDGERLGARQREAPPDYEHYQSGNRENGGMWYALNGPLVVALSKFELDDAREHLRRITLAHHAETFPGQWPGIWSSSDNLESGLRVTAGMPDPQSIWSDMPIYCAHPHAWVVYAWSQMRENRQSHKAAL
jgi:cellobiose phosphorylase